MADQPRSLSRIEPSTPPEKSTPAYPHWILRELTKIAILLGEEIGPERLSLTVAELVNMNIKPDHLQGAFRMARQKCKFFPRPAEIFEFIRQEQSRVEILYAPGTPQRAEQDRRAKGDDPPPEYFQ